MLKRLELIGFKSFADRTRFDFGPGVTAVVGPNGSGKSNVVDAIRWILGEQSAKSLRGKEMADVIFNGSGGRRSLGMAEVSLAFDNRRHFLPIESDEVVIARRIYRSGEGEYYINGQLARLRDIREMFLGTGAGIGAYSIIEQGKVDQMLQASPQDRRTIFEEAAGVSKFRVQKAETMRRLDRVGQNLLRIQDIHEELEKQLRGLRSQAGKARKYKEYADRLRELRLGVGRFDLARFDARLETIAAAQRARQDEANRLETQAVEDTALLEELEAALADAEASFTERSEALAQLRQRSAATEAMIQTELDRMSEADARARECAGRLVVARKLATDAEISFNRLADELAAKATVRAKLAEEALAAQAVDTNMQACITELRQKLDHAQRQSMQLVQSLARLENEQSGLENNLKHQVDLRDRLSHEIATDAAAARRLRHETLSLARQQQSCSAQLHQLNNALTILGDRRAATALQLTAAINRLAAAKESQSGLVERIDVLATLERRHEGLASGVREALSKREQGDPAWRRILGVLAENLQAPVEYADLVELALGAFAQALLVDSQTAIDNELVQAARSLTGRILVVPIEVADESGGMPLVILPEDFTNPSLADVVECGPQLRPLVDRLLGCVYVVDDLSAARCSAATLRTQAVDRHLGKRIATVDLRFITRAGELLEPDGSLAAGSTKDPTAGIVARQAELRGLRAKAIAMANEVAELESDVSRRRKQLNRVDVELADLGDRRAVVAGQRAHFEATIQRLEKNRDDFLSKCRHSEETKAAAIADVERLHGELMTVDDAVERTHDELKNVNEAVDRQRRSLVELELDRESKLNALGQRQVELAKFDERLRSLETDRNRTSDQMLRQRAEIAHESERLERNRQQVRAIESKLLAASAELADWAWQRDSIGELGGDAEAISQGRERRRTVAGRRDASRRRLDQLRAVIHADELQATQLRHERLNLLDRTREDYAIDLVDVVDEASFPIDESSVDAYRLEIAELREKVSRLGAVNLEAIRELDELEGRSNALRHQMNDLAIAERHLQQVIGQINEESRRLFIDTFETVRGHFQDLFRRIFGGGKADVILEDETDVLDSGIEIIARPPGKEPRSISLLSGGEKTMAAVALLMALFRSKPSPFCILDEVDAALDEANIGRFVALIREFTGESQFVLITHSKTTMAAADMLHGVTQRESGISLRVSVRLEDVDEEGRIAATALAG